MFKKIALISVVFSILMLSFPIPSLGETPEAKRVERARQVKEKIGKLGTGRSAVVKLKLYNDTEYKGYVNRSGDSDFDVIDLAGKPHTVRYEEVRSVAGRNMSTGAKIAIGVGIGAAVTILIIFLILENMDD